MAVAEFRFYEELNDFLSRDRRKRACHYRCARRATVKQAIESLGVPHTEVELILVNGESVDFARMVNDGDCDRFRICAGCKKIYWPGSHYERMRELIEDLKNRHFDASF